MMFRSAGIGLALVDGEDRILEHNDRLGLLFGPELLGRRFAEFLFHEDQSEELARFSALKSGSQEQYAEEIRFLRAGSDIAWGGLTASRLAGSDMVVRSLSDISPSRLQQVVEFQELERDLLATELHDVVSQPLVTLHMRLQLSCALLSDGEWEKARIATSEAARHAVDCVDRLSTLMYDLRNPLGEDLGLFGALERLVKDSPVPVDLRLEGHDPQGIVALFIYRIVGEALTNAYRHANATHITMSLKCSGQRARGNVSDNGRGFVAAENSGGRSGHGLKGMRSRSQLLRGSLVVTSEPGAGTVVAFSLPIRG